MRVQSWWTSSAREPVQARESPSRLELNDSSELKLSVPPPTLSLSHSNHAWSAACMSVPSSHGAAGWLASLAPASSRRPREPASLCAPAFAASSTSLRNYPTPGPASSAWQAALRNGLGRCGYVVSSNASSSCVLPYLDLRGMVRGRDEDPFGQERRSGCASNETAQLQRLLAMKHVTQQLRGSDIKSSFKSATPPASSSVISV